MKYVRDFSLGLVWNFGNLVEHEFHLGFRVLLREIPIIPRVLFLGNLLLRFGFFPSDHILLGNTVVGGCLLLF